MLSQYLSEEETASAQINVNRACERTCALPEIDCGRCRCVDGVTAVAGMRIEFGSGTLLVAETSCSWGGGVCKRYTRTLPAYTGTS
jgi:hypothetical protein